MGILASEPTTLKSFGPELTFDLFHSELELIEIFLKQSINIMSYKTKTLKYSFLIIFF